MALYLEDGSVYAYIVASAYIKNENYIVKDLLADWYYVSSSADGYPSYYEQSAGWENI